MRSSPPGRLGCSLSLAVDARAASRFLPFSGCSEPVFLKGGFELLERRLSGIQLLGIRFVSGDLGVNELEAKKLVFPQLEESLELFLRESDGCHRPLYQSHREHGALKLRACSPPSPSWLHELFACETGRRCSVFEEH